MALIQWNETFSVNIKEMDAQHQKLIEIINRLHEAMRTGKGNQEINSVIEQMINYSQHHFQEEEKLMAAQNYSGYLHQKAEHLAFIRKVNEFKQKADLGQVALSISVSSYLNDWLTRHILIEDKKYSQYLNKRGIL
jgi:hemerythrin